MSIMGSTGRTDRIGAGGTVTLEPEEEKRIDDWIEQFEYDRDRIYHKFDDEASGGWTYAGDGSEQIKFFSENSNVDEVVAGMTDAEKFEFSSRWASGVYMSGQLYKKYSDMTRDEQRAIKIYDKTLDKSVIREGVRVVRRTDAQFLMGKGTSRASVEEINAMRGQIVDARAPMSTGAAKHGLTIGTPGKNIEYVFHIPGGARGAGMWIGGTPKSGSGTLSDGHGAAQREVVINRDTSWAVGRAFEDKSRGVIRVNLYYVGRKAHKYD